MGQIKERSIVPTNYLHVKKPNKGIQGEYALDLSLPLLLDTALCPINEEPKPNLYLGTERGPVIADVWIIPDVRGESRQAVLRFHNLSGSVEVKVVRRLTQNHPCKEGKVRADICTKH